MPTLDQPDVPSNGMKPSVRVITLGVSDLPRALAFYRDGLGWPTEGIVGQEFEGGAVVFFELAGGVMLALYPQLEMLKATGLAASPSPAADTPRFTLGHNVASPAEVDEVLDQARHSGAPHIKPGSETAWGGYLGAFQDPDGHLWEVVWNPQIAPLH